MNCGPMGLIKACHVTSQVEPGGILSNFLLSCGQCLTMRKAYLQPQTLQVRHVSGSIPGIAWFSDVVFSQFPRDPITFWELDAYRDDWILVDFCSSKLTLTAIHNKCKLRTQTPEKNKKTCDWLGLPAMWFNKTSTGAHRISLHQQYGPWSINSSRSNPWNQSMYTCSWNPKANQFIDKWMEMMISNHFSILKVWNHHPINHL